jgi:16S rRNA (guanine966-N2)-methyltransferase
MGRIRIIAGEFKGRRLDVPDGRRVRPTSERVREALFSILGERVVGARVLDAYAGTGALGLEALSRGAGEVVFVESDRAAVRRIREHVETLGAGERCTVHEAEAISWLKDPRGSGTFDLILADPPYAGDEARRLAGPAAARRLVPGGWLVLERDADRSPVEGGGEALPRFRTARYGGTCLDFYRLADC